MLTKEELLTCCEAPNINDVSLELYREFSETYLIPRKFHYDFLDGSSMELIFTEWGIYHMLSIQHIDNRISKMNFFAEIKNGLSFRTFQADSRKKKRFKGEKSELQCLPVCIIR